MALIRARYATEAEIRGSDPATRLAIRQERSVPILARVDDWLAYHRARASAKSPLGEALAYIAKYRDGLGRFLTDGRVEIDNNTVERTIRPIALNRKKRPLRRPRCGGRKLGRHRLAHRDLQDEQRRSPRMADRHAHCHRPRPQAEPDRRPAPLELHRHGVIGTPLTPRFVVRGALPFAAFWRLCFVGTVLIRGLECKKPPQRTASNLLIYF